MTYNITLLANVSNPDEQIAAANAMSGGIIGPLILVGVFLLFFKIILGRGYDPMKAMQYSLFITSIAAGIMLVLNWVAWEWASIPIVLMFVIFVAQQFNS